MAFTKRIQTSAMVIALGLGLVPASHGLAEAQVDAFTGHVQNGQRLFQGEQYRDALAAFEQAYALRQSSSVLLALAQTHQRLGNAQIALDTYDRYLTAVPISDPIRSSPAYKEAEQEANLLRTRLRGSGGPAVNPAPGSVITPAMLTALLHETRKETEVDRIRARNRGLTAGGAVLFGTAYFGALMTGAFLVTENDRCGSGSSSSRQELGPAAGTLFIPFLGPIISGLMCREVLWSTPWILVDGAAQIGGLAMMIVASRSNLRLKTRHATMQLVPYSDATSRGLALGGTF